MSSRENSCIRSCGWLASCNANGKWASWESWQVETRHDWEVTEAIDRSLIVMDKVSALASVPSTRCSLQLSRLEQSIASLTFHYQACSLIEFCCVKDISCFCSASLSILIETNCKQSVKVPFCAQRPRRSKASQTCYPNKGEGNIADTHNSVNSIE